MFDGTDYHRRRRSPDELLRHPLPLAEAERLDPMAAELLAWWRVLAPPRLYPGWRQAALIQGNDRLVLVAIVRRHGPMRVTLGLDQGALGNCVATVPIRSRSDALALFGDDGAYCILSGSPAYHTISLEGGPVVCRRVMLPFSGNDETAERLVIGLEPGSVAAPGRASAGRRAGHWLS